MLTYFSDTFPIPLPEGHRFPSEKYRLLRERLFADTALTRIRLAVAPAASDEELGQVHSASYLAQLCAGSLTPVAQRRIGFPWSPELIERCRRSTGGTLAAARAALREGVGLHLAGGTHHAFPDHGQGFCVFNDVAVAFRVLQQEGLIRRAVVIDCDVHQGNGTAKIFANDPRVFTFSMHGQRNFPFAKCDGDLDIALPDRTGDEEYLRALEQALFQALPLAEVDCVFYLAGADPFVGDRYGRLHLSKQGLATRDRLVLSACRQHDLPVTVMMAGGYAPNIDDIVDIHTQTVSQALRHFLQVATDRPGWASRG